MSARNDRSKMVDPATTVVVYDRSTGEVISLHHFAAVEDVPMPAEHELHEIALRHALLGEARDEATVAALSVEPQQVKPRTVYRVSVEDAALVEVPTDLERS